MQEAIIYQLADIAALAQQKIQRQSLIDPLISINRQMRQQGFAIDVLTIDHLASQSRLLFIIDDANPHQLRFQITKLDCDPSQSYQTIETIKADEAFFLQLMQTSL